MEGPGRGRGGVTYHIKHAIYECHESQNYRYFEESFENLKSDQEED